MKGTLTGPDGTTVDATQAAVQGALGGGEFFWLDVVVPGPEPDPDLKALLLDTFQFHPLAVDASDHFGQRARIDARDARAQASGNHLVGELARVSAPKWKDRRKFR